MLKFGICSLEQLARSRTFLMSKYLRRACYVGLYEDVGCIDGETGRRWEEEILSGFTLANGAFKRTSRERMGQFDHATIAALKDVACGRKPLVVHDMAVSDGRTACDFFLKLSAEFDDSIEFYATDVCLKVIAVREPGRRTTVVVDDKNNVLQLMRPPFVLPMRAIESWLFPVNRLLRIVLMRTAAKRALERHKSGDKKLEQREVQLVCREARRLLMERKNFYLDEYDVFEKPPRSHSLVRAMNIFNLSNFPKAAIAAALVNVYESLEEQGLFVVGSNGDAGSTVDGGIYRKVGGGFSCVYSSGKGSAINDVVLRTPSYRECNVRPISIDARLSESL
jgi:hypothetical protein